MTADVFQWLTWGGVFLGVILWIGAFKFAASWLSDEKVGWFLAFVTILAVFAVTFLVNLAIHKLNPNATPPFQFGLTWTKGWVFFVTGIVSGSLVCRWLLNLSFGRAALLLILVELAAYPITIGMVMVLFVWPLGWADTLAGLQHGNVGDMWRVALDRLSSK